MDRDPACRGVLQTAESEDGERVLEPFRAPETPVRQQAVIAEVDAENSEDVVAHDQQDHAGPTEEPRHERKQREQMIADQEDGGEPNDTPNAHGGRQRQPPRTQRCCADANRLGSQRHSPLASPAGAGMDARSHYPISAPTMSTPLGVLPTEGRYQRSLSVT